MARRTYSDRQRAEALAALDANGGNLYRTAEETGVPRGTLRRWANGQGVDDDVAALRQEKQSELADICEAVARKCFGALPGKVDSCNAVQLATVGAIAIDKMQLLRGLPTANVAGDGAALTVGAARKAVAELRDWEANGVGRADADGGGEVP